MNGYTLARWIVCISALLMLVAIGMQCADASDKEITILKLSLQRLQEAQDAHREEHRQAHREARDKARQHREVHRTHIEEHRQADSEAAYEEGRASAKKNDTSRRERVMWITVLILIMFLIGYAIGHAVGKNK